MDIQSEFIQTLEQQAGLDEPTANKVAEVAMNFGKEHAPELISQYGPEPFKSLAAEQGGGGGGIGGMLGGLTGH